MDQGPKITSNQGEVTYLYLFQAIFYRSSQGDSDSLLGESRDHAEPMISNGIISDDDCNDAYWPELEEPEPENDPDFTVTLLSSLLVIHMGSVVMK